MPDNYIDKIRDKPAALPPLGIVPSFDNPPNNNPLAIAIISASFVITTSAFFIRVYSKAFCTKKVYLADCLGILSFPFFVAGIWILITVLHGPGFFVHQWDLRIRGLEEFLHSYVLSTTLFCVTLALAKAAILLEWTHVFVVRSNRSGFYWTCYSMIAINTSLYIATIVTITYACTPRERIWRRYLPGTCINFDAFNIFITTFHLMSDILMLLLPQRIIWKLRLATRQKIGISVVFSGGAIACIWAAGRVASAVHLTMSQDSSFAYSQYIVWGLAEVSTAQIVFCVPTFPVIFRDATSIRGLCRSIRSKTTNNTASLQRLGSNSTASHISRTADHVAASDTGTTVAKGGAEDRCFAHPEPSRLQGRRAFDQYRTNSELYLGGILITTEIDIMTHERTNSSQDV
ncbi:hypothetical protein F5B22DRAFT_642436 [Xylaria bambusicola]|uniref:uncharacterized protein n=1 Tax=Xylaria bambusicola TaxID=326684 RepID=UPI0020086ECD|nr:uncharacterized protein F5B22DRAFT_642436 [Xylaria bambusicola]KAI0525419.1 hypothetical protein F5B22DRAFT_642436 [Xylaria bambusicola]